MTQALTNQNGVLYNSNDEIDMVIYANTSSYSESGHTTYTENIFTPIAQTGRPVGIYSLDNGATWNDVGGSSNSSSVDANITIQPLVLVTARVDDAGIVYSMGTTTTNAFTIIIKLVILAEDSPGILPSPVVNSSNPYAYTSSQGGNYRKIIQRDIVTGTNDGAIHTVAHNLGKIPIVNSWTTSTGNNGKQYHHSQAVSVDSRWDSSIPGSGYVVAYDNTNIYANFLVVSNDYEEFLYRIYQE